MVADERQPMTIRLDGSRYQWLREQAYKRHVPMQRIIDEAIDLLRHTPAWSEGEDGRE
jgi:hypothetical protein